MLFQRQHFRPLDEVCRAAACVLVSARFGTLSARARYGYRLSSWPRFWLMKKLNSRQWLVVLAFVLVVSFTGLFAVRTVRRAIYWHYHQDEPIRPWMNLGYIARSYNVPPWVLRQALGLPPTTHPPDKRPIRAIAREQHRSVNEVVAILQDAIVHARPPYPPPGPPPPPDKGNSQEPTRGPSP